MPSIGVLEANQQATDKPRKRVKRSIGQAIVRRGIAVWIIKNVLLHMRVIVPPSDPRLRPVQAPYIPFGLEPSIDAKIGVKILVPSLTNQVRFRPIRAL